MLLNISQGKLNQSPFVLLVDNVEQKGSPLLSSVVRSLMKCSPHDIHIMCWEQSASHFQRTLGEQGSNVHIHDCFTDSHGWINSSDAKRCDLLSQLKKFVGPSVSNITVVIDSLSSAIFTVGLGQCLQDLRLMTSQPICNGVSVQQVLCLVHGDALPGGCATLPLIKHLASTVIEINNNVAYTTHRKPGGHIEKKEEAFSIASSGELIVQSAIAKPLEKVEVSQENAVPLPEDVASFRVSLNESEREARNKLVLPYLRTSEETQTSSDRSGGKVFYQPDAADDWDEEDPDDDLDV